MFEDAIPFQPSLTREAMSSWTPRHFFSPEEEVKEDEVEAEGEDETFVILVSFMVRFDSSRSWDGTRDSSGSCVIRGETYWGEMGALVVESLCAWAVVQSYTAAEPGPLPRGRRQLRLIWPITFSVTSIADAVFFFFDSVTVRGETVV